MSKSVKDGQYDKVPKNYQGTVYICPMHPEVRDVEASDCPICGMFLKHEDEVANSSDDKDNHTQGHSANSTNNSNAEAKVIEGSNYNKVPADYDGTIYICPMHSEVRDTEKSDCPICGMFLKPENEVAGLRDDRSSKQQ